MNSDPHPISKPSKAHIMSMFDALSSRYDLFNRVTSLGMDYLWRKKTVATLPPGSRVLDIGCGSGDLSFLAYQKVKEGGGRVLGIDFSKKMLEVARAKKLRIKSDTSGLTFECVAAEDLPIEGAVFGAIISAFVLRNLYENIEEILDKVYQSLRPGGVISFVDMTEPPTPFFKAMWLAYMNGVVVFFGRLIFGKDYPVGYITASAARFLKADDFIHLLHQKGFVDVDSKSHMFGMVTLYRARKSL